MTLTQLLRAACGVALGICVGFATADDRKPTPPAIPKAVDPDAPMTPVVAKVVSADPPVNGTTAFPKMLADAKDAHAKARDYVGHFVRQERVGGTLQAEQTGEIRVRAEPFSVHLKVMAPKAAAGWEGVFVQGKRDDKMRFKPAGVAGLNGFVTVAMDSPKAMAGTLHPLKEVGLLAVLTRAEKIVEAEKKLKHPVSITVAEYTFNNRPCQRYDIYADRPHPTRYCHHAVLFVDTATKLPVRFEAYDQPKLGEAEGELIEVVSFVNVKLNAGQGDSTFDK